MQNILNDVKTTINMQIKNENEETKNGKKK